MKALICITSCNRLNEVKKYIWDYISYCNRNSDFDFLLALDGNDQMYLDFCKQYQIPLLYSDDREGVGMSKNRVLKQFPDYDYYFFIEDDVELLDSIIFNVHINQYNYTGIHHFGYGARKIVSTIKTPYGNIFYSWLGSAQFNFFTNLGLKTCGGWHPIFAKHKRYGHTEHSLRFVNSGLSKFPFCICDSTLFHIILHDPPHVTQIKASIENSETQLNFEEELLIEQKLCYFPITTLSEIHFNGFNLNYITKADDFLKANTRKYPLTNNIERKIALSEYYFLKINKSNQLFINMWYLFLSLLNYPLNNPLKHYVKLKIFRHGK